MSTIGCQWHDRALQVTVCPLRSAVAVDPLSQTGVGSDVVIARIFIVIGTGVVVISDVDLDMKC